jgi:hypothetical protein
MTHESLKSSIFHRSLSVTLLIKKYVGFGVVAVVTMDSAVFWVTELCSSERGSHYGGICRLRLYGQKVSRTGN